jgi:hypothetical protein
MMTLLASGAQVGSAYAAPASLRGSDQDGYSRLVIDFGGGPVPGYSLADNGATGLTVTLNGSIEASAPSVDLAAIDNVAVKPGASSTITLTRPSGAKYRALQVGNRLLIDVYADAAEASPVPPASPPVAAAPQTDTLAPETATEPARPPASPPASPPATTENAAIPSSAPFGLEITSTQNFAMAAFRRGDSLWIVVNQPDFGVPPHFLGSAGDVFGQPQLVDAKEATAFRLPIKNPDAFKGLMAEGEGGGLIWRLLWKKGSPTTPPLLHDALPAAGGQDGRIEWHASKAARDVSFEDPIYGDTLIAVTVKDASEYAGPVGMNYPQLDVLPSAVGMGIAAKADDIAVKISGEDTVSISRPGGLALSDASDSLGTTGPSQQSLTPSPTQADAPAQAGKRFFQMQRWSMGGFEKLRENHLALMSVAGKMEGAAQAEQLLRLAKLHLAHGQGQEAVGLLELAQESFPALAQTPDFLALKGASAVIGRQYDLAYRNLFSPSLDQVTDIPMWRAAALAGLEDWGGAAKQLPISATMLNGYQTPVKERLALSLAEVALRDGQGKQANAFLALVKPTKDKLLPQQQAAYAYFKGEAARQSGDISGAKEIWEDLRKSPDDYFRARAGLALVALGEQDKTMKPDEAIDRLEALRYAWRGDELEIDIASKLGDKYIARKEYLRGLAILRSAAKVTDSPRAAARIVARMNEVFTGLMSPKGLDGLTPVQALTLYREFNELLPAGAEGQALVRNLSEKLAASNMFESAQAVLAQQGKQPANALDGATDNLRLAALALADGNAENALNFLGQADKTMAKLTPAEAASKQREAALLRARALSQQGKPKEALEALSLLQPDDDVLRLRGDIAWQSGQWAEAAQSIGDLVQAEKMTGTRPPTAEQAALILNWAVALNLSNNRYVLANVRERYTDLMAQTDRAKEFEVVTRPRQNVTLADRDTLKGIVSEVDLFKDFLDSYGGKTKPAANAPAGEQNAQNGASGGSPPPAGQTETIDNPANIPLQGERVVPD